MLLKGEQSYNRDSDSNSKLSKSIRSCRSASRALLLRVTTNSVVVRVMFSTSRVSLLEASVIEVIFLISGASLLEAVTEVEDSVAIAAIVLVSYLILVESKKDE